MIPSGNALACEGRYVEQIVKGAIEDALSVNDAAFNLFEIAPGGREMEHLDENIKAPSAGASGEPSHTIPSGIPICPKCGKSTRSGNRLVCKPCENGTRLILTSEDRKWLREIGVSRR